MKRQGISLYIYFSYGTQQGVFHMVALLYILLSMNIDEKIDMGAFKIDPHKRNVQPQNHTKLQL